MIRERHEWLQLHLKKIRCAKYLVNAISAYTLLFFLFQNQWFSRIRPIIYPEGGRHINSCSWKSPSIRKYKKMKVYRLWVDSELCFSMRFDVYRHCKSKARGSLWWGIASIPMLLVAYRCTLICYGQPYTGTVNGRFVTWKTCRQNVLWL